MPPLPQLLEPSGRYCHPAVVELGLQTGTCWLCSQGGLGLSLCFAGLDALNCKIEVTVDNHFPEAWGGTYV